MSGTFPFPKETKKSTSQTTQVSSTLAPTINFQSVKNDVLPTPQSFHRRIEEANHLVVTVKDARQRKFGFVATASWSVP